jgi:hypothetical protein
LNATPRVLSVNRLALAALAIATGVAHSSVLAQGAPRTPEGTFRNNYRTRKWAAWASSSDGSASSRQRRKRRAARRLEHAGSGDRSVALRAPVANPSVTWIGQATVLVRPPEGTC